MAGQRTHDRQLLVIGSACAALGLYFVLVGLGLAPAPSKINGPQWPATCVGLVFLAGAVMVLVRGWLNLPGAQDVPADAPRALLALELIAVVAYCAGLVSAAPGSPSAKPPAISCCRCGSEARSPNMSAAPHSVLAR